jgi:MFS family permease
MTTSAQGVSGVEEMRSGPGAGSDRPRRAVIVLLAVSTAIGSAGLAAGGTAGALLGVQLAGTSAAAGLPLGLLVAGSAAGALFISRQAQQGRRGRGLMIGYLLGAVGAVVVIAAAVERMMPLLLVGSTVLGVANSAIFLTRYAALDAGGEEGRGRALGTVFFATAIGAVLSPLLLGPSGALAQAFGLPRLSGLYLVAVVTFGIAALLIAVGSSQRLPWFGRGANVLSRGRVARAEATGDVIRGLRGSRTGVAFVALGATNFVMVGIMAIAPVHMMTHGRALDLIGPLIALHVAGMFGPSPVSGYLADRFGPVTVVLLGASLMLATCVGATLTGEYTTLVMSAHLLVLGMGWNCGVVGGSMLLAAAVPDSLRPHAEGIGEVVMGLAAAVAAPVAGVVVALRDYRAFLLVSAAIAVCVLVLLQRLGPALRNQGRGTTGIKG